MAEWVDLLSRADAEPEHVAAARRFLAAVLIGTIKVTPDGPGAWSFIGRSRLDGRLAGSFDEEASVVTRYGNRPPNRRRLGRLRRWW
jgi:hypothetical protein